MNILITGATGFIGRHLVQRLKQSQHTIKVLSRDGVCASQKLGVTAYSWDYATQEVPAEALENIQVIIHLMGENLGDGRWTDARKRAIYESRILSTRKLVMAAPSSLECFICGSAIGIYPGQGDGIYDESYAVPDHGDFMQTICRDWEKEAANIESRGVRRVSIRTGVVLGRAACWLSCCHYSNLDWADRLGKDVNGSRGFIFMTWSQYTKPPSWMRAITGR